MRRYLSKILKWFLRILASLMILFLILSTTSVFLLRSSFGQRKVLEFAMPKIQEMLIGRIQVQSFSTDVFHRVTLNQIQVFDKEKQLALSIEKIEVHYKLLPLFRKLVHITSLEVKNAFVHAYYLSDQNLNLSELVKPRPPSNEPLPVKVQIDTAYAELQAQAELLKEPIQGRIPTAAELAMQSVHGQLVVSASAWVEEGKLQIKHVALWVQTLTPAMVSLQLSGSFFQEGKNFSLDHVACSIETSMESLTVLLPKLKAQGPLQLLIEAHGPSSNLQTDFRLKLPVGQFESHIKVDIQNPNIPWQLKFFAQGVDLLSLHPQFLDEKGKPLRISQGARRADSLADIHAETKAEMKDEPRSLLAFTLEGHGDKASIYADLKEFHFQLFRSQLDMALQGVLKQGKVSFGKGWMDLSIPRLAEWETLGLRGMRGSVLASAKVEYHKEDANSHKSAFDLGAKLRADRIRFQSIRADLVTLDAHMKDMVGALRILARGLQTGNAGKESSLALEKLLLEASSKPKEIGLQLKALGPRQTRLELALEGTPLENTVSRKQEALKGEAPRPSREEPQSKKESQAEEEPYGSPFAVWEPGVRLFVHRLTVARLGKALRLERGAPIEIESFASPSIKAGPVVFALEDGRIAFTGSYQSLGKRIRASLHIHNFDIQPLSFLFLGEAKVPRTRLFAEAHVEGTPMHPVGQIELSGVSARFRTIPKTKYKLNASLNQHKASGGLSLEVFPELTKPILEAGPLRQATMPEPLQEGPVLQFQTGPMSQQLLGLPVCPTKSSQSCSFANIDFSVSLKEKGEMHANVQARTQLHLWQQFLPPQFQKLRGEVLVNGSFSGTKEDPVVSLEVKLPWVQLDQFYGRNVNSLLLYHHQKATWTTHASFEDEKKKPLGTLNIDLTLPLPWAGEKSIPHLKAAWGEIPIQASLTLHDMELPAWLALAQMPPPVQKKESVQAKAFPRSKTSYQGSLGKASPLRLGSFSTSFSFQGTVKDPHVQIELTGKHLVLNRFPKAAIDMDGRLLYKEGQLSLQLGTEINRIPFLFTKLGARFSLLSLIKNPAKRVKEIPLEGDLTILSYPLSSILPAQGQVEAMASLRGTFPHLQAKLLLRGKQLKMEESNFGDVEIKASYNSNEKAEVQVEALQAQGRFFKLHSLIPLPFQLSKTTLELLAKQYTLNYFPKDASKGPGLRALRGEINADVKLRGLSKTQVPLEGYFRLQRGAFGITTDPRLYENIGMEVLFHPQGDIELKQLSVSAEKGSVKASGRVKLKQLALEQMKIDIDTNRFPVSGGSFGAWVTSTINIQARSDAQKLHIEVSIPKGRVDVPKLSSIKSVQSLEESEEVRYVDAEGLKKEQEKQEEQEQAQREQADPSASSVPAFVPENIGGKVGMTGPFLVRGPEVDLTLEGRLTMDIPTSAEPDLRGFVRVSGGHVEILEKRYQIQQAQVNLDGSFPPNPTLDVRISRQLANGVNLILGVSGTAKQPRILLQSDPATYDQTQIIAILLTGDPKDDSAKNPGAGSRALGLLSGLIVSQLKDQISQILPIDVLKIETGGAGAGGLSNTRVEAGRYIGENLYLGVVHQFGNITFAGRKQNRNEARLEWQFLRNVEFEERFKFLRNLELDTRIGDEGVGSLGFALRFRF